MRKPLSRRFRDPEPRVKVWRCYDCGPEETQVLLAGTEHALMEQVRELVSRRWVTETQGPLPEDWHAMIKAYEAASGGIFHFGHWGSVWLDNYYRETRREKV